MRAICSDLNEQYQELDEGVSGLDEKTWYLETPFFSWTIFDEVAHLAFFDREAMIAVENPDLFKKRTEEVLSGLASSGRWPAFINPALGSMDPADLLSLWRETRTRLLNGLRTMDPRDRLPWYGPDMSARSFATARLMETWAHAQDVFDTLRVRRVLSARLRHVAHIGVTTFGWSFVVRGLTAPDILPCVELTGPAGETWKWGAADSQEWVRGSAEDFCLVVTQRRNVADTRLEWQGKNVEKWLTIAQAFAGVGQEPPGPGVRRS